MKHVVGIAFAALVFAGSAWAAPVPGGRGDTGAVRHSIGPSVDGRAEPDATGSIGRGVTGVDAQGRDLRSSTRGNARFPEREPEAQNLGGTAGGPGY